MPHMLLTVIHSTIRQNWAHNFSDTKKSSQPFIARKFRKKVILLTKKSSKKGPGTVCK
jgi:hypothetical protein